MIIFGAVVGTAVIRAICNIAAVRLQLDKMKVHMPLMGKLWKVIYTARFARTLSSLYAAGIPIVTAMQIARNSIGNTYIDRQFDTAVPVVRAGGNLSEAIEPVDGFIKKLAFSIRVGEEMEVWTLCSIPPRKRWNMSLRSRSTRWFLIWNLL